MHCVLQRKLELLMLVLKLERYGIHGNLLSWMESFLTKTVQTVIREGATSRGGEWYPENRGSRKFFIRSRNLGNFCDESRSLVFHVFLSVSESRIFLARSRSLGFAYLAEILRQKLSR